MRIGLFFKKIGCSVIYQDNRRVPVTLLCFENTSVVSFKTKDKDGYDAVVLGYGNFSKIKKPQLECLKKNNISDKYKLYESRALGLKEICSGSKVGINHFVVEQYVDVTGWSIGKGFAGVMKRHNFKGLRASHGVSIAHRSQGSTGQCQDPGRVFKGKKMAGHLGASKVTVQNIKILLVDEEDSVLVVKGNNIPGHKNSYVYVRDAIKKPLPKDVPFPFGLLKNSIGEKNDIGQMSQDKNKQLLGE